MCVAPPAIQKSLFNDGFILQPTSLMDQSTSLEEAAAHYKKVILKVLDNENVLLKSHTANNRDASIWPLWDKAVEMYIEQQYKELEPNQKNVLNEWREWTYMLSIFREKTDTKADITPPPECILLNQKIEALQSIYAHMDWKKLLEMSFIVLPEKEFGEYELGDFNV